MTEDRLYIVLNQEKHGKLKGSLWLGYLPWGQVPRNSVLWTDLRKGEICYTEDSGFRGIYLKKKHAIAHAKIEGKWRDIPGRNQKSIIISVVNKEGANPICSVVNELGKEG